MQILKDKCYIFVALLCLQFRAILAVTYYGFTPTAKEYQMIEGHAAQFNTEDTWIDSVFVSRDSYHEGFADFLARANIHNTTYEDYMTPKVFELGRGTPVEHNAAQPTGTTEKCVTGNKIHSRLSQSAQNQICQVVSAIAGGGVGSIAYILMTKYCAESTTGNPTFCNVVYVFAGVSGTTITASEMSTYCPYILNYFSTSTSNSGCAGQGGIQYTNDPNADQINAGNDVTQSSATCSEYNAQRCTMTTAT